MMFDYNSYQTMMGNGSSAGVFMWIMQILVIFVLVLSAIALWKYIGKK